MHQCKEKVKRHLFSCTLTTKKLMCKHWKCFMFTSSFRALDANWCNCLSLHDFCIRTFNRDPTHGLFHDQNPFHKLIIKNRIWVCVCLLMWNVFLCCVLESNLMHEKAFTSITSRSFFYEIRIDVRIGVSWKVVHGYWVLFSWFGTVACL